jgi:two-component system NarL family sensor kinase
VKKHLCLFWLYTCFIPLTGIPQVVERSNYTLQKKINTSNDDTNKVKLYLTMAGACATKSGTTAAFDTLANARALSVKLKYPHGLDSAFYIAGIIYETIQKDYPLAIQNYKAAARVAAKYRLYNDAYMAYRSVLNLDFYLGNYPGAMEAATKGITLSERLNDKNTQAEFYGIIGFIYLKQGNITEIEKYYGLYLQIAKQLNNRQLLADAYNCIGDTYIIKKDYQQALSYYFAALNLYKKMGRQEKLSRTKTMSKLERLANTFYRIGNAHKLAGNYNTALRYALNTITYTHRIPCNKYDVASYYISTGDIYKQLLNYKNAERYLDTGLAVSREISHHENIRDALHSLSQVYAAQHQYGKAYHYYVLFNRVKDSITNERTGRAIEQIHQQYNVEKKDKEIALLNQQQKLRQAEAERQNLNRSILISFFILMAIISFLLYNRYQLKQKNIVQAELNRQRGELFNTILTVQDQERKRIAQDIHDGLGSVLSAVKLKLSGLQHDAGVLTGDQQTKYQSVLGMLDEASVELRNISHNLMPATLARLGLVAALQNLADGISSYPGLHVHFTEHGFNGRITEEKEMSIYRIILELINNTVKHSRATQLIVQLIKHPLNINIIIEDNGIGFNYLQTVTQTQGIGLNNIRSRVEYLKGRIDFDSRKGEGTSILIDIPYP